MEQTVAVSAHKDAIIESISCRNVNRVVPKRPAANTVADREIERVVIPGAAITREDVKCRIISQTAVDLVVVGTFGRAWRVSRQRLRRERRHRGGVWRRRQPHPWVWQRTRRQSIRSTFLDGRSENEARENGEGKRMVEKRIVWLQGGSAPRVQC